MQIDIADPFTLADNAAPITGVCAHNQGVATSGRASHGFLVAGQWHSHLLGPRFERVRFWRSSLEHYHDFYKGRGSCGAWARVINVSGGFLAQIAVTGLRLLLCLKTIRRAALLTMLSRAMLTLVPMKVAS